MQVKIKQEPKVFKPVVECQHCNGLGHLLKTIGTNERGD